MLPTPPTPPKISKRFTREGWEELAALTLRWFPGLQSQYLQGVNLRVCPRPSNLLPNVLANVLQAYRKATQGLAPCLQPTETEGLRKGLESLLRKHLLQLAESGNAQEVCTLRATTERVTEILRDLGGGTQGDEDMDEADQE